MKHISIPRTVLLISLFGLGIIASYLLPTLSFGSAFGQTETLVQDRNNREDNNTLGNNNTVSYSYNVYNDSNNQTSPVMLHNNSVNYYENNNSTGYLVYPELANNTQPGQQLLPAVIMIHEWWGLMDR